MHKDKAIFHLPGAFLYSKLYDVLLNYKLENPTHFKDCVEVGSLYGSPTCIWNGGRLEAGLIMNRVDLVGLRDWADSFGIPIRFTFTNQCIQENHLADTYGNMLLNIFCKGNNEIILNSPLLEQYIRDNYGDSFKYISSTTKRLNNKQSQLEEIEKNYHLIVLDYDYNKDFSFLESIKDKYKCELLCNPVCSPRCKRREDHYRRISECQLNFEPIDFPCVDADRNFFQAMKQQNFISAEDIENVYLPMGFNHFKLEGRTTYFLDLVEIILYYLIKEEHRMELRYRFYQLL